MRKIDRFSGKHIEQLHRLFTQEWWTKTRTLDETRRVVEGSTVVVGIVDETGDLAGFVRVVSDMVFKAFVFDLIVRPDMRHQGLGERLMRLAMEHKKLKDVKSFELYCLPEMKGFYEQFGFRDIGDELRLMRKS